MVCSDLVVFCSGVGIGLTVVGFSVDDDAGNVGSYLAVVGGMLTVFKPKVASVSSEVSVFRS